jgi:hypothetical protein
MRGPRRCRLVRRDAVASGAGDALAGVGAELLLARLTEVVRRGGACHRWRPPRSRLAGDAGGELRGAEAAQVGLLVEVAGVALLLGELRDDLVRAAECVFVRAAAVASGVQEGGLSGGLAHNGGVGGVEPELGELSSVTSRPA